MKERLDSRVLGAIRWIDAVTLAPIALPLVAESSMMEFTPNLSGLAVITEVDGLEAYTPTFNLDDLAPADVVATGSLARDGTVTDPTGNYLPTKFTLHLPRDPSTAVDVNGQRPANSLFTPIDVALLPSPSARVAAGCAQVRVLILDSSGQPIPNALARVIATTGNTLLGCGLADARGEALVAILGLQDFAPGSTPHHVVVLETEARLEIIHPPAGAAIVDWTVLRDAPVAAGDTDPNHLQLRPGGLYSRRYPFS